MTEITNRTVRELPQPIVRTLCRLIRRIRLVILLRGLAAVSAVAVSSLLVIMAIDYGATIFSAWPRWTLSFSALGLTALTALLLLVRPLVKSFTLAGIARSIEIRHPELQERISSAVELLTSNDRPEFRGSDVLIAALARQATRDARSVAPRREVTLRKARPYFIAAAAAGLVLLALLVAWPAEATRLLARAVAPSANLPNVSAWQLTIDPDHDSVIAEGDRLHVEVAVANKAVSRAHLRTRFSADGPELVETMTPLTPDPAGWPRFAITCPPAQKAFSYRIHAGDALSRFYNVSVVPPPALKRLDLRYEFPAYTARAPRVDRNAEGDISAVAGTVVTLTALTSAPVSSAELLINGDASWAEPAGLSPDEQGGTACSFRIKLPQGLTGKYDLTLTKSVDGHRFTSRPIEHRIEASSDMPPTARIVSPDAAQLKLKRNDLLPIFYSLSDDHGLSGAQLLLEIDGRKLPAVALPLARPQGQVLRAQSGKTALDLAALDLVGAQTVNFRIRALDNLPPELKGPQEGFSAVCTIQLDAGAPSYVAQMEMAQELVIRQSLQRALEEVQAAKADSAPLRESLAKVAEGYQAAVKKAQAENKDPAAVAMPELASDSVNPIDDMRKHLGAADEILRQLAQAAGGGMFPPMAEKLTDLDESHVVKAQNLAEQIKLTDSCLERATAAKVADFHIDRAIAILSDMLKELSVLTEAARNARELQELAQREMELAAARAAMAMQPNPQAASGPSTQPGLQSSAAQSPPMAMEEWQKQQEQLAGQLAQKVRQSPTALPMAARRDKKRSEDLAALTHALAKSQLALAGVTEQIKQLGQTEDAIHKLAAEQAALAHQAAADKLTAEAAKPMAEAAENFKAGKQAEAVQNQAQAEAALAKELQNLSRQQAAEELTRRALAVAQNQKTLADKLALAKQAYEAAAAKAAGANEQLAVAAQQAQQDAAAAAQQQVADSAKAQQDLAVQAGELSKQAASATPAAQEAVKSQDPAAKMQQAAAPMAAKQPAQAAQAAAEAAKQADQLAQALKKAREGNIPATQLARESQQVGSLAAQQADLHKRAQQLAARGKELDEAYHQGQLARLRTQQDQAARDAGQLADRVEKTDPQADRIDVDAAGIATEAARKLQTPDTAQAAALAAQAGQKLTELARRLGAQVEDPSKVAKRLAQRAAELEKGFPPADSQPSGGGGAKQVGVEGSRQQEPRQVLAERGDDEATRHDELAKDAGSLAARQQRLAREMEAMVKHQPTDLAASQQRQIGEGTAHVAEGADLIDMQADSLIPDPEIRKEAQTAVAELGAAGRAQHLAEQALASGGLETAVPRQQVSAVALKNAAEALERLGKKLADLANGAPPAQQEEQLPEGQLAKAFDEASQAARDKQLEGAERAAALLAQLAARANAQAQQMGVMPMLGSQMAMPMMALTLNPRIGAGMMLTNNQAVELEELGISASDWARLPGELRDEVLQAANDASPEEYRLLIKRYFQELARRGGAEASATTQPSRPGNSK